VQRLGEKLKMFFDRPAHPVQLGDGQGRHLVRQVGQQRERPFVVARFLKQPQLDTPQQQTVAGLRVGHTDSLLVTNRFSLAQKQYETGRALLEPLARDHPKINSWAISLGKCYFHLAHLAHKQGNAKQALTWSTQAIRVLAPALRKDPQNLLARITLRGSHALRALLNQAAGRDFAALADLYSHYALEGSPPPAAAAKAKGK
jgi:hypothetical protein